MHLKASLSHTLTHPLTVVGAGLLLLFLSTLSSHTVAGSALSYLSGPASHQYEDHVGPRRIVTYDVVIIDGQTHIVTDSGPYQDDSLAKALQLIHEEVGPQTPLEFYEVRFARWFSRRTGLIVPMTTREKFFVWTTVFDPETYDHVPASARRAAVDAFVAAWPAHADHAAQLLAQDEVVIERIAWDQVAGELISYGLIAIVVAGIWVNIARWRQGRARSRARPSPSA